MFQPIVSLILESLATLVFVAYTFMVITTLYLEERVSYHEPAALFMRATRTGLVLLISWSSAVMSILPVGGLCLFMTGPAHVIGVVLFFLLAVLSISCWLWAYGKLIQIMHAIEYALPVRTIKHITFDSGKLDVVDVKIG